MACFATAAHLASWAGICPGNNESGGKRCCGRTRQGDTWLRAMLVQCAWSASRTKGTYLKAQFWQIARRRGKEKAAVAVAHSILVIAYHLLADQVGYEVWERTSSPVVRIPQRALAGLCVNWSSSDTRSL
jgi:transposase